MSIGPWKRFRDRPKCIQCADYTGKLYWWCSRVCALHWAQERLAHRNLHWCPYLLENGTLCGWQDSDSMVAQAAVCPACREHVARSFNAQPDTERLRPPRPVVPIGGRWPRRPVE